MSAVEPQKAQGAGLGLGLKAALGAAILLGLAAVLYVIVTALAKPNAPAGLAGGFHGKMGPLEVMAQPIPAAPVEFVDASGKTVKLSDFKGTPVVLNLWATWCAPCVKEMPTLAALQSQVGPGVKILTISTDSAVDADKAKAFLAKYAPLTFYQDSKFAFMTGFTPHITGFPSTVFIDRKGYERAILAGEADWSTPEAKAAVQRLAAL
jgi:thiol-disulfide isomerase/thioredoxin